jgi:hypothetical protein
LGFLSPVPDLGPVPKENLDRCKCKGNDKKKKKKKGPRNDCSTYVVTQFSDGTRQSKKKAIPCEPKPKRRAGLRVPKPTFKKGFPLPSLSTLGV